MATEKRLIDANTLSEELSTLTMTITGLRAGKGVLREFMAEYRNSVLRIVDEQPTVAAVEVVRCKECKHYEEVCGEYTCFHPKMEGGWNSEGGENLRMNPMDFCSYGERKADD